jgi:AraC family transcriptional regulator
MHKKETLLYHSKVANDTINYMINHIETDINVDELSRQAGMSKYHFHRIFKKQIGTNVYETIKSIRLQKASNLLITNRHSTVTEIANMYGYASQTSFLKAFKQRFNMTPKEWKNGGHTRYSDRILSHSQAACLSNADFSHLQPKIIKLKAKKAYYIRHKGYDSTIKQSWQKMLAWLYTNGIEQYEQIGIYHDNPIITPLQECYYIVCAAPKEDLNLSHTQLPCFEIPEGVRASFEVEGKYGDILKLIQWVYHIWLPQSGYETTTLPAYSVLHKNHFLSEDKRFKTTFYLPIQYI